MSLADRIREGEDVRAAVEHDLRNPLTVITGYAELLRARDDEQTRLEAADMLVEAVARINDVVREIGDIVAASVQRQAASSTRSGARRTILIVDDDVALRSLIRSTLSPEEFDIIEASDGQEALGLIAARPPDLVLLDWNMPRASGGEVLERLAREHPAVGAVVITAEQGGGPRQQVSSLGGHLLTKPFSPTELLRLVDDLLAA